MSKLVVIGGSAGSIHALRVILARLPGDFAAPVLVAVHIGSRESVLPSLLQSHCALQVSNAIQGQPIVAGQVLIAHSDLHLTVAMEAGAPQAKLVNGPKENHCRPAIDPLFRSAAIACGADTIGVLLSGFLDDGTVGLQAIRTYGGVALVQDPDEAEAPDMPTSALAHGDADFVLRTDAMAPKLVELVGDPRTGDDGAGTAPQKAQQEIALEGRMLEDPNSIAVLEQIGTLVPLTCPECHGALWEIRDNKLLRYRCHTGHAYTAQVLAGLQNTGVEEALWAAVRALHEQEQLYLRLLERTRHGGQSAMAPEYQAKANLARDQGEVLRDLIGSRVSTR